MAQPKRKHPRLSGYDYSQNGAYFVTLCTKDRRCVLSEVVAACDGPVGRGLAPAVPRLLPAGWIVEETLCELPNRFLDLRIEKAVIMPNHVHLLLTPAAAGASPRPTGERHTSIVDVMRAFKSLTTRRWNRLTGNMGKTLWQTSYHDHVVRDDNDFLNHWSYIDQNPLRWAEDEYYVCVTKGTEDNGLF